jgi:hypothetical protein
MSQWSGNRTSYSLGIFWVQWNISLDYVNFPMETKWKLPINCSTI